MIQSKKISLILLTALLSINTARYTYAVVNDPSTSATENTTRIPTIYEAPEDNQTVTTMYVPKQQDIVFNDNSPAIQNIDIKPGTKNPTIFIDIDKLIVDKLNIIDKKTTEKTQFIFNKPATLVLNATDVKNIRLIDLQSTASSIIINNTDRPNNEIEDFINSSDTTTSTVLKKTHLVMSLVNQFEGGNSSTIRRGISTLNLLRQDNKGDFDLSILSSDHLDYGIMKNNNNGTIHVVGKSKTDQILDLSSDIHLYGQVDLNTKPPLETNQTHGMPHTITIHAGPNSKGDPEPGKLIIRGVVIANIQTKDDSELIIDDNDANIVFHQLGTPEEYIKTLVKDKSKLSFQCDNTAHEQQQVDMYNNIIADIPSKIPGLKNSAILHFFDPGNGSSITYNIHGSIGTPNNRFPEILLHEKSNLSVQNGIYAKQIILSLSEKNKGNSSTSSSESQPLMPDANTPQSIIYFNRYNYIKHLKTDKANRGIVIIQGKYDSEQENPRFFSAFQGDIGTASAPLYAINFQEKYTPEENQRSYNTFTINSQSGKEHNNSRAKKEHNSIFLADGLNFANENDELEIKGKYKITGNIQRQKHGSITSDQSQEVMGHIKVTNNSQLDFAGNIGANNKPIASIHLDKDAHFNSSSVTDKSYYSKKLFIGENSVLNLSKISLYTDILPIESGNGTVQLQDGKFVGNIGTPTKNVKEVAIVLSDVKDGVNKIAGNVYTDNYHVKNDTRLVGNHTVYATTPNGAGVIKFGCHKIMVDRYKYTLEADNIEFKGISDNESYSHEIPPSKKYSIFHISYDINDDGTVKNQGQIITKSKVEGNEKIIVQINHVRIDKERKRDEEKEEEEISKHNANTKIIPVVGNLSDSVYICDDKCRWVKGDHGEFVFSETVVPKVPKKKKREMLKQSAETAASTNANDDQTVDDRNQADDQEILLAHTAASTNANDDQTVNDNNQADDQEMLLAQTAASTDANDDQTVNDNNQADGDQEMLLAQTAANTQDIDEGNGEYEQEYNSTQYSNDNDDQTDNRVPIRDYYNNNEQVAFVDHDAHRIHHGSRHHHVSKMRSQHAVANTLTTKIGSRLFNLSNINVTVGGDAEVISAGSEIVRNRSIGVWADGFIGKVNFDSPKKDQSTNTSISGFMIGVDSHINDNLILGAAVSWSTLDTKIGNNAYYSSDNSAFIFTGYGQLNLDITTSTIYKPFVQGVVNIINHNIIPSTEISGHQAKGNKYSSSGFNGSVMFGYPLSAMESMPLVVVPMVGARYSSLTTPSHNITYTYNDTAKTTSYGESHHSLIEGVVGISLKYLQHVDVMTGSYSPYSDTYNIDTESVSIIPEAHMFGHLKLSDSISHATVNTTSGDSQASFLTYNDPLQLSGVGVDLPNSSLQLGLKATVKVNRIEFAISGDVYFGSNYSAYMGMLHIKANL